MINQTSYRKLLTGRVKIDERHWEWWNILYQTTTMA